MDPVTEAVISHKVPERPPTIQDLAAEVEKLKGASGRREEVFKKQVEMERGQSTLLNRKFDELLKEVKQSGDKKPPKRAFDLD
ncbi:MAG: hypothetical protein M3Z09_16730 [Acidobacteriota bacterium]|nr:hypothetical protein [Acidobacteriota bacterium]